MVEPGKAARNFAIVVLLAVIVWQVPGGGTASNVVGNLLSVILLAGLAFFGYRLYMEHRTTLFTLDDRLRVVLYASAGMAVFAAAATSRMWDAGGLWVLLWFAMLGAASYGVFVVFRASRSY
jgi:hypothetical protein